MADDLQVELEEVVADSIEYIEFEGDHAYRWYSKSVSVRLSQNQLQVLPGWLTYLCSLHRIYISTYFCCIFRVYMVRIFF